MNIMEAEEKLAAWIAETTSRTENVYRSPLPRGVQEGFEVLLVSGVPAGCDRVNEFTVEVRGFAADRRELWEDFEKIFAALPLQKQAGFLHVDTKDEVTFSTQQKEGKLLASAALKLKAAFV